MFEIAGLGSVLVDHAVSLPNYPAPDTKSEVVDSWLQVGGPVPTALALLSRFGKKCVFAGKWAQDHFGQLIEADLQREGVDFSPSIRVCEGQTGFAQVWIDQSKGTRTIAFMRGTFEPLGVADMDDHVLHNVKAVLLDGWSSEAAVKLATRIKQGGGIIFLDAGSPKPGLDSLLALVDVLFCSQSFLDLFFGSTDVDQGGTQLLAKGPQVVVVTSGNQGASLFRHGERFFQPAFPVPVQDTTGAGDVFCGAMIFAMLEHWPLPFSLRFAAAAAALKCMRPGNRAALPGLDDVFRFIDQ